MNKSKSLNEITEARLISLGETYKIKKSKSLSDIQKYDFIFEEFFEGDGPLGISFINKDDKVIIRNIIKGSVADETYGLYTGMIVSTVNNIDIELYSYNQILDMINTSWYKESSVDIQFKKPIYNDLLKMLVKHNLLNYYDNFIELGARTTGDFDYIEMSDLCKMKMTKDEISIFLKLFPKLRTSPNLS
jgi:hypothetical protein